MATATTVNCAACDHAISIQAYDCPKCGHPLRKPTRGFFGWLFKWTLIAFNVIMVLWLFAYWSSISDMMGAGTSDAEQAGAAIGATMGTAFLLVIWVLGDIILGLGTILTRPRK